VDLQASVPGGAIYMGASKVGSINTDSNLTVRNTFFENCHSAQGGGICVQGSHNVEIKNSQSLNCWVVDFLGMAGSFAYFMITTNYGNVAVDFASVISGSCSRSGSIYVTTTVTNGNHRPRVVSNSLNASFNYAGTSGSGLYIGDHHSLSLQFCRLESNRQGNVLTLLNHAVDASLSCLSFMNDSCVGTSTENGALLYVTANYAIHDSVFLNNSNAKIVGFGSNAIQMTFVKCFFDSLAVSTTGPDGAVMTSLCEALQPGQLPPNVCLPLAHFHPMRFLLIQFWKCQIARY
jgi:hypothetical protein